MFKTTSSTRLMTLLSTLLLCAHASIPAHSKSITHDLTQFLDTLGSSHQLTKSQVARSQQAGFYTGGSFFNRNTIREVQPIQVAMPSASAGCGGIDLFMGSFSYINAAEYVNMLKSIMANATGYAFKLALKSVSPQISGLISELNNKMSDWTRFNINSCELSTHMVGGLWPQMREASKQICQDIGAQGKDGLYGDWFNARRHCNVGQDLNKTLTKAQKDPSYRDVIPAVNLAWKALQKNPFFAQNRHLSEFIMSLTGTIILPDSSKAQKEPQPHILKPLMHNDKVLAALIFGGKASIYQCDEPTRCMRPHMQTMHIEHSNALKPKIGQLLHSMAQKIEYDKTMNTQELALLQSTQLPLYKMLNVQSAFHHGKAALSIERYSETIALDVLYHYLIQTIHDIDSEVASFSYPKEQQAHFKQSLQATLAELYQKQHSAYQRLSLNRQLVEQTKALERMLVGLNTQLLSQL